MDFRPEKRGLGRTRRLPLLMVCVAAGVVAVVVVLTATRGEGGRADNASGSLHFGAVPAADAPQPQLVEWAEYYLSGRCMAALGFDFTVDWASTDELTPAAGPFATDDVAWATRHGYGLGPSRSGATRPAANDANRVYVQSLPPARQREYTRAYFGDGGDAVEVRLPDGSRIATSRVGCLADARRTLYGDLDRWVQLDAWASNLEAEVVPAVMAEPDYRAALSRWRECMRGRGMDFADPGAAQDWVVAQYDARPRAEVEQLERRTAVADAECTRSSGLREVAERLHGAQLERIRRERAADLEEFRALMDHAGSVARDLRDDVTRSAGP